MASIEKFYEYMKVRYYNEEVQKKFKSLLDDVIRRLPNKSPFKKIDEIFLHHFTN